MELFQECRIRQGPCAGRDPVNIEHGRGPIDLRRGEIEFKVADLCQGLGCQEHRVQLLEYACSRNRLRNRGAGPCQCGLQRQTWADKPRRAPGCIPVKKPDSIGKQPDGQKQFCHFHQSADTCWRVSGYSLQGRGYYKPGCVAQF